MLKISDVAQALGYRYISVYRWVQSGRIKAIRIGGRWRIEEKELERIKSKGLRDVEK